MMLSHMIPRCLYVAAQLDIATQLGSERKTAAELARETGVHGATLHRILRTLAGADVFRETAEGCFENSALSHTLRTNAPGSLRPWVLIHGDELSWRSWGNLEYSVKSGTSAFEDLYGEPIFDYLPKHPDRAEIFDRAMSAVTTMASNSIVTAFDFSGIQTLVDIGGGNGTMLCAILEANPALKGIVFDLPHVENRAQEYIASRRLTDRCTFVGGSFFEAVPPHADAYFVQRVLHDWDDVNSVSILHSCAKAARAGAKVIISEAVIGPPNEPSYGKLIDLHMLVMTHGGKERSEAEYRELLSRSGWDYTRTVATTSPFSLVEGVKDSRR
jgi:hypothetical protein